MVSEEVRKVEYISLKLAWEIVKLRRKLKDNIANENTKHTK